MEAKQLVAGPVKMRQGARAKKNLGLCKRCLFIIHARIVDVL